MAKDKYVLITGASSGIGKELAYLFARDRYSLVLTSLDENNFEQFGKSLGEVFEIPVHTIVADLSEPNGAKKVFDEVKKKNISIDIMANNAGVGKYGLFKDIDMEDYFKIINVNVTSYTYMIKLFLPQIIENRGKILNTASIASHQPGPNMSVYYATKAYDLSLSLALAEELENAGVTVTALCPGPTITNFQHRANMEKTRSFQNPLFPMQAKNVAEIGYEAMMKGKRMVIAGVRNKLTTQLERFFPKRAVTKYSEMMLEEISKDEEKEKAEV